MACDREGRVYGLVVCNKGSRVWRGEEDVEEGEEEEERERERARREKR